MNSRRNRCLPLLLVLTLAASCLACWLCYRYDNKYTMAHPYVKLGVTEPDMARYGENPFFYLADGWAFYRDRLLTPAETGTGTPDAYFYLGRYGGFDLGDPDADPHGRGTYRMVVLLDGTPRQYALELPPVFSRWRLWVNGALMQSVGMGDGGVPGRESRTAVFTASDKIEIVAAVEDEHSWYSGMVYPPALGSPAAVDAVLSARLLLHGGAVVLALALGLLCLVAGTLLRFAKPYRALALLCLCLAGTTAGPVLDAFGLPWTGSPGQRACFYGVFLALAWTVGRVCGLPKKLQWPAAGVGLAVCAAMLLQPLLPLRSARGMLALSAGLGLYKLLTALWILAVSARALHGGRRGSAALLCGGMIFAGALVMDRLLPVYEPIYGGWFGELAGWAVLALIGGAALWDTVALYHSDAALRTELAVRAEHARLQQEYVRETRERLHESRGRLTRMTHYLDAGRLDELRACLEELSPAGLGDPGQYTGNTLVDAVLSAAFARADREGVYVEQELSPLPEKLPYDDADLTTILTNLLDNALEANARLGPDEPRWLSLRIAPAGGGLEIACQNAAPPPDGETTSKADKGAHGYGLPLIRKAAARYGGRLELRRLDDCCGVTVTLQARREEAAV